MASRRHDGSSFCTELLQSPSLRVVVRASITPHMSHVTRMPRCPTRSCKWKNWTKYRSRHEHKRGGEETETRIKARPKRGRPLSSRGMDAVNNKTAVTPQQCDTSRFLPSKVERTSIRHKTREQGWREIAQYRREQCAAALIQRWTRGALVRRRVPLVRNIRVSSGGAPCAVRLASEDHEALMCIL